MPVSPIPSGYHSVTPYLIVDGATAALAWYAKAFGAREVMRLNAPGGKIGHAEIDIGDSRLILADESPAHDAKGPAAFGGSPISLHLYVPDVDATIAQAAAAGASITARPEDGTRDRQGTLRDPFGHTWHISTHIRSFGDEIERRLAAMIPPG